MEGSTIRLRASCNACNESKVRCSQDKPMCTRCERNGIGCIYGLSRRTHKDAPPISIPSSHRPGRSSWSSANGDGRGMSFPKSTTATSSNSKSSLDKSAGIGSATIFGGYMSSTAGMHQFSTYNRQAPDSIHHAGQLLDFSSQVSSNMCFSTPSDIDFSTLEFLLDNNNENSAGCANPSKMECLLDINNNVENSAEYANSSRGSLFDDNDNISKNNNNGENGAATDMAIFRTRHGECTCHVGVAELLASMCACGDSNRRLSLDAQLSKLKRCIVLSEMSMGCAHNSEDTEPIHIMAVTMLISYIIDDFKVLASESPLRKSSAAAAEITAPGNMEMGSNSMFGMVETSANTSMGEPLEPRLSWGQLELEDDDETDIRQRLYLLSFRKLERLMSQLTLYLRDLHNERASLPDPSRRLAFVIACDYMRVWLEKKAEDVKKLFSVSATN